MNSQVTAVRGMKDLFGEELSQWKFVEEKIHAIFKTFGFSEIRTPALEKKEVFSQTVGEDTDIVEKQMYQILSESESMVLRPEGTASFMRAIIEHNLHRNVSPQRYYYYLPMFRHERPQKGRLRQFFQFGAELIQDASAESDAEIIVLLDTLFRAFNLTQYEIRINSVGCNDCRPQYSKILKDFIRPNLDKFCELCKKRFERAPIRLLDCKNESCQGFLKGAPKLIDHLCVNCVSHQSKLENRLKELHVKYILDPQIVRGLDYYSRTAFEFTSDLLGAQSALAGGGRYDELATRFGEKAFPAIGFGMGMERLVLALGEAKLLPTTKTNSAFYFAPLGEKAFNFLFELSFQLKKNGIGAEMSYEKEKNLKWHLKQADRLQNQYTVILGDNEMTQNIALLKDMKSGEQKNLDLKNIESELKRLYEA